jgi:hypothetical protein
MVSRNISCHQREMLDFSFMRNQSTHLITIFQNINDDDDDDDDDDSSCLKTI